MFGLKFGKAREAQAAFKEVGDAATRAGFHSDTVRVLVDLVGPYYTLVLESTFANLIEYEQMSSRGA